MILATRAGAEFVYFAVNCHNGFETLKIFVKNTTLFKGKCEKTAAECGRSLSYTILSLKFLSIKSGKFLHLNQLTQQQNEIIFSCCIAPRWKTTKNCTVLNVSLKGTSKKYVRKYLIRAVVNCNLLKS